MMNVYAHVSIHQACAQMRAGAFKCKCKRRIKCKCSAFESNASANANAKQPNQMQMHLYQMPMLFYNYVVLRSASDILLII